MIITANTKGITIDVTGNAELTALYQSRKVSVFTHNIDVFVIKNDSVIGECLFISDFDHHEYCINQTNVTSINGVSVFANVDTVFNAINNALLGV